MRNGNNPEEIFRQILSTSQAEETEVTVDSTEDSLTRFANNTIHQNVSEERISLTVRVVVDRRTASASTNRLDEASLRRSVEAATRMARLQPPDPEWLSMAEPQTCPPSFPFLGEDRLLQPRGAREYRPHLYRPRGEGKTDRSRNLLHRYKLNLPVQFARRRCVS